MGYSDEQLLELEQTINATDCDVVVSATPVDLTRLVDSRHPVRHATYELEEIGTPTLTDVLAPIVDLATTRAGSSGTADSAPVERPGDRSGRRRRRPPRSPVARPRARGGARRR